MDTTPSKAGWRPAEYAAAIGISRSMLYALPAEMRPRSVKFGIARVFVEPPAEFLARLAAAQSQRAAA